MPAYLIVLALLQGPAISTGSAAPQELRRLEAVWNEAHVKGDADALDALWVNDIVITVAAMPIMSKADALAVVRSNRTMTDNCHFTKSYVMAEGRWRVVAWHASPGG